MNRRQEVNQARKTRSLKSRLHAQSKDLTEHRQHIGKIGEQSLENSWAVKGWVDSGTWQGIIPWPSLENFQATEAAITAALGTDDWGFQDSTATTFATLRVQAELAEAKAAVRTERERYRAWEHEQESRYGF